MGSPGRRKAQTLAMLKSLKVSHKLLMIYALDMVAVIFLGWSLADEKYIAINFARKELAGLEIIDHARRSLRAALSRDPDALHLEMENLIRAEAARGEGMDTVALVRSAADQTRAADAGRMIAPLRAVIARVGDMSNLILDPDLDSYYAMSLTILRFPELTETLFRLSGDLEAVGRSGRLDNDRRIDLLLLEGRLTGVIQGLDNDLDAGLRGNPDGSMRTALGPPYQALSAALSEATIAMRQSLAAGSLPPDEAGRILAAIDGSRNAAETAWGATVVELDRLLRLRIDQFFSRMVRQFGTAALLLVIILTAVLVVARRISKPLAGLAEAADRVRLTGDYSHRVDWSSGDEIGRLATAFNRMVEGLEAGDEAKRLLTELEAAQAKLLENNAALEKASRLVLDSIGYARKIQDGLLPDASTLGDAVAELHINWQPLHQVGGDYYWLRRTGRKALILLADCTGHGVPGAFMTVVVASVLDRILMDGEDLPPSQILERLDEAVRQKLRQDRPEGSSDDGLDASICLWDGETATLTFAGANMPLLYWSGGRVESIKGSRRSLGYRTGLDRRPFIDHDIAVRPGTIVYMFTDGLTDHVGGQPPQLFGRRRLADVITANIDLPLPLQVERMEDALGNHRGDQNRRDDMTIIAFRPY